MAKSKKAKAKGKIRFEAESDSEESTGSTNEIHAMDIGNTVKNNKTDK